MNILRENFRKAFLAYSKNPDTIKNQKNLENWLLQFIIMRRKKAV